MIEEIRPALLGLTTCRDLLREPLMLQVRALLDALAAGDGEAALEHYTEIFYGLRQAGKAGLVDWLWVRGAILLAVCIKYWYLLCRVKTAGRAEEEAE